MPNKIKAAIVGATGVAGQQFVAELIDHPLFEITALAASKRSAGRSYGDALQSASGQQNWLAGGQLPAEVAGLMVQEGAKFDATEVGVVFSALDSAPARELEAKYATTTPVLSTASAFRYEPDVPLLLPGINLDHATLLRTQQRNRGWKGFVAPGPNCTTVGLAITLAPLRQRFGIERVLMTSMQAVSGAGRTPGVPSMDVIDNIIPYIPGEEEKVEKETQKILGTLSNETIEPAGFSVSCTCTRVAVLDAHTEAVFVQLSEPATENDIVDAWRAQGESLAKSGCPTAPKTLIQVHTDPYRPQPRLDRDAENGMATAVGRLRKDSALKNGWKYVLVSHNTKMGAANGSILVAEHLLKEGYIS